MGLQLRNPRGKSSRYCQHSNPLSSQFLSDARSSLTFNLVLSDDNDNDEDDTAMARPELRWLGRYRAAQGRCSTQAVLNCTTPPARSKLSLSPLVPLKLQTNHQRERYE